MVTRCCVRLSATRTTIRRDSSTPTGWMRMAAARRRNSCACSAGSRRRRRTSRTIPHWWIATRNCACWLTAHVPGPRPTFPGGVWVDGGSHWWHWTNRGFPRFLEFDGYQRPGVRAMRALASAVKRAFDVLPTRWLVVRSVTVAQLAALLKQTVLARLTELTVQLAVGPDEANEAARLLANCRHLRNLRGLALAFTFGDAGCEALASAALGRAGMVLARLERSDRVRTAHARRCLVVPQPWCTHSRPRLAGRRLRGPLPAAGIPAIAHARPFFQSISRRVVGGVRANAGATRARSSSARKMT